MQRALSSLAAAAVLLVAGACSDEADEPDPQPRSTPSGTSSITSSALTEGLAELYAGNSPTPLDLEEGRCFADALQERLDDDALLDAGIVTDGAGQARVVEALPVFDEPTAQAWVDAQLACVDYVEVSTRALLTQTRGDLDAERYAECLRSALTDDEVRAALVQTLTGGFDSPEVAALATAQADCAT